MIRTSVLAITLAVGVAAGAAPASAAIVPVAVDGTWTIAQVFGDPPIFFPDTYTFTCGSAGCTFDISANYAISPTYEVFDFDVSIGTTPAVPGWEDLGCANWFTPACRITDPDDAWADPRYSKLSIFLAPGDHEIDIKALTFALNDSGGPLPDARVQFRVTPVPLPAALPMFFVGLAAVGLVARRRG